MLPISSLARIQKFVAPWTQIMRARLEPLVIFLSFTIIYLSSIAEGYLITTTINQIDDVRAAISKQDINNFHVYTPKLLNQYLFPSGQIDVNAVLALIAARLSYIPFFNEVKVDQVGSAGGCTDSSSKLSSHSTDLSSSTNKSVKAHLHHRASSFKKNLCRKFCSKKKEEEEEEDKEHVKKEGKLL
ncbi:hypothetical protein PGT21_013556 [Puccinia graminis f. sp. tritici]|uniref:Uncharacterized protein n=1 Tax=Puccinia graminis f. sp. tritici TaxID=56615 RepID=A0A5B0QN81_PUCGR|nr:hypothetical protein PGT21_013556 [Puccinia graminis f. sp. tritici]